MRPWFRVLRLPLGILTLLTAAASAFAQCPPVPEGSLPEAGDIARYSVVTPNGNSPPARLAAKLKIPVKATGKTRLLADAAVIDPWWCASASAAATDEGRHGQGSGISGADIDQCP
jgi:hypothetical protein